MAEHVAIMRASWGLTRKILTGEKTVETRWYKYPRAPWGKVSKGDKVYFKDSGKPVNIVATVSDIKYIGDLDSKGIKRLLCEYGPADGIEESNIEKFHQLFKDKRYCMVVSISHAQEIEPFEIDKSGFGTMAAWITVPDVSKINANKHK